MEENKGSGCWIRLDPAIRSELIWKGYSADNCCQA